MEKIEKSEAEWREQLTPEQYEITREHGTEPPFTGRYVDTKDDGTYCCVACGNELFSSDTKFESGTGWPSFFEPADNDAIELKPDNSLFMRRTEVVCARCGSHLGHLFDDGPDPDRPALLHQFLCPGPRFRGPPKLLTRRGIQCGGVGTAHHRLALPASIWTAHAGVLVGSRPGGRVASCFLGLRAHIPSPQDTCEASPPASLACAPK